MLTVVSQMVRRSVLRWVLVLGVVKWIAFGVALLLAGCAHPAHRPAVPLNLFDPSGMVHIVTRYGIGQACPISAHEMLTAQHLAVERRLVGLPDRVAMVWSDGGGRSGSAWTLNYDLRRDLALLASDTPLRPYPIASEPPIQGDTLIIGGYDLEHALAPTLRRVRLQRIVAGHLIVTPAGSPGYSGSCVIVPATGEVVGIYFASLVGSPAVGLAVGIWGQQHDVSWSPQE